MATAVVQTYRSLVLLGMVAMTGTGRGQKFVRVKLRPVQFEPFCTVNSLQKTSCDPAIFAVICSAFADVLLSLLCNRWFISIVFPRQIISECSTSVPCGLREGTITPLAALKRNSWVSSL